MGNDTQLADLFLKYQSEMREQWRQDLHAAIVPLCTRMDEFSAKQDAQNTRVQKLDKALGMLWNRLRLIQRGSIFGSLSTKQKAAFWGALAGLGGLVAEGAHRLIPLIFDVLTKKVQP